MVRISLISTVAACWLASVLPAPAQTLGNEVFADYNAGFYTVDYYGSYDYSDWRAVKTKRRAKRANVKPITPKDVAEVAAMVTDKRIPGLLRREEYFGDKFMGTTYVFVHRGLRYTLYHSGARIKEGDANSAWLSFWVRKNGTYGQKRLDTFTDHAFDAAVDFGIDGLKKKYFRAEEPVRGAEHRAFWQQRLERAVRAALEYKKRFKHKRKAR